MSRMAVEIRLEKFTKRYGTATIVDGVSLRVPAGKMLFVLGPSGCGKTTLLRMVAGLTEPNSGQLWFDDRDVSTMPTRQRNIGMVFQNYALWPHMTVLDNVAFGLRMRKIAKAERERQANAMLEEVDLGGLAARKPGQLSGGQQQRVALARALVVKPDVLLLDEPLSNLDANLRVQLRELIRKLCTSAGLTALYVTHDQEEAMALADEIVVMRNGIIEQTGSPSEIYSRPRSVAVAQFLGETNLLDARVKSVADQSAVLETKAGAITARGVTMEIKQHDRVSISIRPESLRITGAEDNAVENHLKGTIAQSTRRGLWSRLVIELPGGCKLVVHEPGTRLRQTGEACALAIDPQEVVVLPASSTDSKPSIKSREG